MMYVILQNNTAQSQIAVTVSLKGTFHHLKIPCYYVAVGTDCVGCSVLYNCLCSGSPTL